ncbi:MAG: class I SAM-dependent methyltransferase [Anaerolineales bacterium]|nr:class I SAM-dependent methyltransferase [Anaerolineales bacterium]
MASPADLPCIEIFIPRAWKDYEFLDSGNGRKLERYGAYTFIRPAPQAAWEPALPEGAWNEAHGVFQPSHEESGGRWQFKRPLTTTEWTMTYGGLKFQAQAAASRHMGVFPEQASHWDWIGEKLRVANRPAQVLNLFGYTGLATLAAAQAGARVTHVDASKKAIQVARQNQALSGLSERPVRWIVDDALKFVRREERRQVRYEGLILDPPKFGRGPKGEVWEFFELMPRLMQACQAILSDNPLFIVITAYAIQASALSLYHALKETMAPFGGETACGELALQEKSAGRVLSLAITARWSR